MRPIFAPMHVHPTHPVSVLVLFIDRTALWPQTTRTRYTLLSHGQTRPFHWCHLCQCAVDFSVEAERGEHAVRLAGRTHRLGMRDVSALPSSECQSYFYFFPIPRTDVSSAFIIKIKLHSSCEIEYFVETRICKLCVILRSRVLRVVCPH